eukprot:NODE_21129_length_767_cov_10.998437.p2 GENE.NODE_21129_length_767_cov_10.998437~~NODE_21129_length_767_cov_10.998437.p2  ORF type:complete len:162 (+),score=5.46 NODE_21129_length_767_cov_10.998437:223-708(+)
MLCWFFEDGRAQSCAAATKRQSRDFGPRRPTRNPSGCKHSQPVWACQQPTTAADRFVGPSGEHGAGRETVTRNRCKAVVRNTRFCITLRIASEARRAIEAERHTERWKRPCSRLAGVCRARGSALVVSHPRTITCTFCRLRTRPRYPMLEDELWLADARRL